MAEATEATEAEVERRAERLAGESERAERTAEWTVGRGEMVEPLGAAARAAGRAGQERKEE